MIRIHSILILSLALCVGCGPANLPRHEVVMPDFTASIDTGAIDEMLNQITKRADALRRGDSLTVIPITGDADVDVHGLIVRLDLPRNRVPYDHDLVQHRLAFRKALERLKVAALQGRFAESDIIGTVGLASQEFASDSPLTIKELVIVSDFVHEEPDLNFQTSPALQDKKTARNLAERLVAQNQSFQHVNVLLTEAKSPVVARLSKPRRAAIRAFWMAFFERQGAKPAFVTDSELGAPVSERVR